MSKHTPGPWTLDEDTYTIVSNSSLTVASVYTVDDYSGAEEEYKPQLAEECAANARLIAVAPGLLETLEAACNWWDERVSSRLRQDIPITERRRHETPGWYDNARYFIAKARGKEQRP